MRIEVRLCESLARCHPQGRAFAIALKDGASVGDVVSRLRLSRVAFRLALCNGVPLLDGEGRLNGLRRLDDGDHLVFGASPDSGPSPCFALRTFAQRLSGLLNPLAQTS